MGLAPWLDFSVNTASPAFFRWVFIESGRSARDDGTGLASLYALIALLTAWWQSIWGRLYGTTKAWDELSMGFMGISK